MVAAILALVRYFYPRPPRGGRPWKAAHQCASQYISIHALREEGDLYRQGGAGVEAISIHALREEGDQFIIIRYSFHNISIHALREEGDRSGPVLTVGTDHISIHALREEGDLWNG